MKTKFDDEGFSTGCYDLSPEEAENLGVLPADDPCWRSVSKCFVSTECLFDFPYHFQMIHLVRTPKLTEKEIEDIQYWHKKISKMDFDELRKKVVFEERDLPYQDYEYC